MPGTPILFGTPSPGDEGTPMPGTPGTVGTPIAGTPIFGSGTPAPGGGSSITAVSIGQVGTMLCERDPCYSFMQLRDGFQTTIALIGSVSSAPGQEDDDYVSAGRFTTNSQQVGGDASSIMTLPPVLPDSALYLSCTTIQFHSHLFDDELMMSWFCRFVDWSTPIRSIFRMFTVLFFAFAVFKYCQSTLRRLGDV